MKSIPSPQEKIIPRERISSLKSEWDRKNRKIVFTNGCFDIVHRGHVEYLFRASQLGDILVLGLNSDESVRRLKGINRPVQDQFSRSIILASFYYVDYVCIFDEDTPYDLIKVVQPDILVKGGDYKPEEIVGNDIVKAKNGEVLTIEFVDGYSSSAIIRNMSDKY